MSIGYAYQIYILCAYQTCISDVHANRAFISEMHIRYAYGVPGQAGLGPSPARISTRAICALAGLGRGHLG